MRIIYQVRPLSFSEIVTINHHLYNYIWTDSIQFTSTNKNINNVRTKKKCFYQCNQNYMCQLYKEIHNSYIIMVICMNNELLLTFQLVFLWLRIKLKISFLIKTWPQHPWLPFLDNKLIRLSSCNQRCIDKIRRTFATYQIFLGMAFSSMMMIHRWEKNARYTGHL